jgi:tetratricopeptide (TPR) repeat protein
MNLFLFDEFRTNIQDALVLIDNMIKELKIQDESGDQVAKTILYFYQGLFSIINAEKKYRTGNYADAVTDFIEAEKMISRFQRLSKSFSLDFQQEAERLDLFAKGRQAECQALKKGTPLDFQLTNLLEAINSYTLEFEIVKKIKKPLLIYNSNARRNFIQGLAHRLEGQKELMNKEFREAKMKHLSAYSFFIKASYYNPMYAIWVKEQNNTISNTMYALVKDKAESELELALKLSSEGKFIPSSEKFNISSKLHLQASKLTPEQREIMLMQAYSHMLKARMYEAKANEFIKNNNDAKSATRQYELAASAMKQAVAVYPSRDEELEFVKCWEAQMNYYIGYQYQSQGIFNLDEERFKEALEFFNQANDLFSIAQQVAKKTNDTDLIDSIEKAVAEAAGYIGMCKTVLD